MQLIKRILITFTGFHDPYTREIISEGKLANPVRRKGGKEKTIFFGSAPRPFEMLIHQP
jgi:hypothetical protein